MIKVAEHSEADYLSWDEFVIQSGLGSAFHLWGWKNVYEHTFGFKTAYLSAKENGQIVGVLPLLFVKSPVLGTYLTSLPGGIAGENDQALRALYEHAVELLKRVGYSYLALRDCTKALDFPGLETDDAHVSMVIDMLPGFEEVQHNIDRKTRQRVNKAKKNSIVSVLSNQHSVLDQYYPIYLQAMRERGTPTQGFRFFYNAVDQFPERLKLLAIKKDEDMLGGGYAFTFNHTLVCMWSGMAREFLSLNTSYVLIWETIELANQLGVRWIELGRSQEGSGTYHHKKQWGAVPVQLYQQYYLHKAHSISPTGNSRNEKFLYQMFVKTWQKLPLSITEYLGPKLRTQVPFG